MILYRKVLCEERLPKPQILGEYSNKYYCIELESFSGIFSGMLIKETNGTFAWYRDYTSKYTDEVISWLEEIKVSEKNYESINSYLNEN